MELHRYILRPGITDIPRQLPFGEEVPLSIDGNIVLRISDYRDYYNEEFFDMDYFDVIDKETEFFYDPFYEWADGHRVCGQYQKYIIDTYNKVMDDINWIVRNEDAEFDLTFIDDAPQTTEPKMTLYEMNQQAYDTIAPKNIDELEEIKINLTNFIRQYLDNEYAMLLCKELSDYTVFKKDSLIPAEESANTIIELLQNRGPVLDCHFNKEAEYMECWVRYKQDKTPHMYVLFNCQDFIVKY